MRTKMAHASELTARTPWLAGEEPLDDGPKDAGSEHDVGGAAALSPLLVLDLEARTRSRARGPWSEKLSQASTGKRLCLFSVGFSRTVGSNVSRAVGPRRGGPSTDRPSHAIAGASRP